MRAVYISITVPISTMSDEMTNEKGVLAKIPGTARPLDREIGSSEETRQILGLSA